MSKMGISTLRSYRSAQVFQIVGLNRNVVEKYFTGTASDIEGIGLDEIAEEANQRYHHAKNPSPTSPAVLSSGGHYRQRVDGERHLWTPASVSTLQQAARTNNYHLFKQYTTLDQRSVPETVHPSGSVFVQKNKPCTAR